MKYKGTVSSFKQCPGGGPQGGLLTQVLFCLQVNKAGAPCTLPQHPAGGKEITQRPTNQADDIILPQLPASGQEGFSSPPNITSHNEDNLRPPCHKKSRSAQESIY